MKFLLAVALDAVTTPIRSATDRIRRHTPPWECDHRWKVRPAAVTGTAARSCSRCTALELLCETQPPLHPESMAVLLPHGQEEELARLDGVLWPGELL